MVTKKLIPLESIEQSILLVRGRRVMLDRDLAKLYGVTTSVFNQAVKRNKTRFPEDFMLRLTLDEVREVMALRSQIVILKRGRHIKYAPYALTQEGVAMLSSILNSKRAVQVNIAIMRVFVRLRELTVTHQKFARKLEELERKYQHHDVQLETVFEAIRELMRSPSTKQRRIGF